MTDSRRISSRPWFAQIRAPDHHPGSKAWDLRPRPGKADVLTYRSCKDRRVVADVVRIDKDTPKASSRR